MKGKQIQFAQSKKDEEAFIGALNARFSLLCLPRQLDSADIKPKPLLDRIGLEQIIFIAEFSSLIRKRLEPIIGKESVFHVFPRSGLCIEWDRTHISDKKAYRGRFYYVYNEASEHAKLTNDVYNFICRYLKKECTTVGQFGKSPIYVCPDLAKSIDSGETLLVTRGGLPMQIATRNE